MAWAIVTAAGTPYLCWLTMAPSATALMKACCACEAGNEGVADGGWGRREGGRAAAEPPSDGRCALVSSPGIDAAPRLAACSVATRPETPVPGTSAASASS